MHNRVPIELWIKIAESFIEQQTSRTNVNYVKGFRFSGCYLSEWLQRTNSGLFYEGTFYLWKGRENFKTLFRDTFGIDPDRGMSSTKEEVSYFFALIFKKAYYFETKDRVKLIEMIRETDAYQNYMQ